MSDELEPTDKELEDIENEPEEMELPDPMDDQHDPYSAYSGADDDLADLGLYSPDNEEFNS